jgi:hypothetical protein
VSGVVNTSQSNLAVLQHPHIVAGVGYVQPHFMRRTLLQHLHNIAGAGSVLAHSVRIPPPITYLIIIVRSSCLRPWVWACCSS